MKNPRIERRIIRMKEKFAFLSQNSKHNLLLFFSTAALIALYLTPPPISRDLGLHVFLLLLPLSCVQQDPLLQYPYINFPKN